MYTHDRRQAEGEREEKEQQEEEARQAARRPVQVARLSGLRLGVSGGVG